VEENSRSWICIWFFYLCKYRASFGVLLYRSSDLFQAYQVAHDTIQDLVQKKLVIEKSDLVSAISTAIFDVVRREETIEDAAEQMLFNHIKGIGPNGNRDLLASVRQVTTDDLYASLVEYIVPLFQCENSNVSVTTTPNKVDELVTQFNTLKRKLHSTNLDELFQT